MNRDPFAECFLKRTPRNTHTFSNRARACRFEPPIRPDIDITGQDCPFKEYCSRVVETHAAIPGLPTLDEILRRTYSEWIKNVQSEPSTSVVVRSEQQFHGADLGRLAQRRHLYEVVRNGTPGDVSRFGIDCVHSTLHPADRLGEYLGFVDLRYHFDTSPLAFALLVEPGSMREDPATFVMKGDYGHLFGADSFRSTVYCMQDPGTAGAVCAQMCMIMALGMLSDRGAEVAGSFTLTYLSWLTRHPQVKSRVDDSRDLGAIDQIDVARGLHTECIRDVLRACNAGAQQIIVEHDPDLHHDQDLAKRVRDRLATRLIEPYVYRRFPIILAVDGPTWRRPRVPQDQRTGHALTVVGFRRDRGSGEINSLIVHDPGSQPFFAASTSRWFRAADAYGSPNAIYMIAATDAGIRLHADEAVEMLRRSPSEWPVLEPAYIGRDHADYQIRLVDRNSLVRILVPELRYRPQEAHLKKCFRPTRYWAVLRLDAGATHTAWLFDAETPAAGPPQVAARQGNTFNYRLSYRADGGVVLSSFSAGTWSDQVFSRF